MSLQKTHPGRAAEHVYLATKYYVLEAEANTAAK